MDAKSISPRTWRLKISRGISRGMFLLFLTLMITVFVVSSLLIFDWHWIIIGYLKNEPRYQGLPSAYWKARIERFEHSRSSDPTYSFDSLSANLLAHVGIRGGLNDPISLPTNDSVPVLLYLRKDSDLKIRRYVLSHLGAIDSPNEETIDALIEGLDNANTRLDSLMALEQCGPEASKAVPAILRLYNDGYEVEWCKSSLMAIAPDEAKKRGF